MAGGAAAAAEALVKFEDVIIYFSRDEWVTLEQRQKDLYWKVLKENYEALVIVGRPVTKIDILAWIERHEWLNGNGAQQSKASSSSGTLCPHPSNQRLAQMCHKECTKEAGSLQGTCGGSKVDTALHNDMGGSRSQRAAVPPKQFECGECGKTFQLKSLLQIHQKISVKKVSFPCPECEMCFRSSSRLRAHQRTHLQECGERGEGRLQDNGQSTRHESLRALEKPHFCTDCRQSFRRYLDFLQHQKSHEVAKPWPCPQCGEDFMSQVDLGLHEERHLEEAAHELVACGQNCICEPSLQLHFASPTEGSKIGLEDREQLPQESDGQEEKPYSCVHCGLQFKLEVNLGKHYRYCPKGRLLKRGVNGAPQDWKVPSEQGFHRLVPAGRNSEFWHSQHPSPTSARHACSDPGRFVLDRRRQKHQGGEQRDSAEHDGSRTSADSAGGPLKSCAVKKLHKCQDCGETFVYKWQLAVHLTNHTRGKGYLCPDCGKSFVCRSSLQNHCQVHREEAAYKGESHQENHVPAGRRRKEQGKRLYPCDKCGNRFAKSYMPFHQAFHTGVRYKCLFCGKVFNFQSGALRHLKLHRAKGDFSACPECKGKGGLPSADCLCRIQKINVAAGLQAQGGEEK